MKRVVIDTNVLVSSMLSQKGSPFKVMKLISDKKILLFYCLEILDEYKRVLSYPKLNIAIQTQSNTNEAIQRLGILIKPPSSNISMTDESDRIFYDTARASGSILVTGNIRHYPKEQFIMTPAEVLNSINL